MALYYIIHSIVKLIILVFPRISWGFDKRKALFEEMRGLKTKALPV
jgi:hypothetical protein